MVYQVGEDRGNRLGCGRIKRGEKAWEGYDCLLMLCKDFRQWESLEEFKQGNDKVGIEQERDTLCGGWKIDERERGRDTSLEAIAVKTESEEA